MVFKNIFGREQWNLIGFCFFCRKKKYCGKKCKLYMKRKHLDISGK